MLRLPGPTSQCRFLAALGMTKPLKGMTNLEGSQGPSLRTIAEDVFASAVRDFVQRHATQQLWLRDTTP
jgi:hypothetical protein